MQNPLKRMAVSKRKNVNASTVAIPDWLKEIDLGRSVENLLIGVVIYVGKFFLTQWAILFRPKLLKEGVLAIADLKDVVRLDLIRPLQLFALSGFLTIAFSQKALGGIPFVEPIFNRYPFLSSLISTEIHTFSLAKVAGIMIPLTLVVAFYAYLSHCCANFLKLQSSFRQNLSICAYVCSSLFFLAALSSNFEMHIWGEPGTNDWLDDGVRPLIGIAGMLAAGFLGLFALYRYVYYLHTTFQHTLKETVQLCFVVATVFWFITLILVMLFDPFLQTLK